LPGRVAYWDANLRCRFANRGFLERYGLTIERALGRSMEEILGAEYVADNRAELQAAQRGEAQRFERERVDREGRRGASQVHYVPDMPAPGHVAGIYSMAFDITPLKRAETE